MFSLFGYRIVTQEYLDSLHAGARMDQEKIGELEAEKDRLGGHLREVQADLRRIASDIDLREAKDFANTASQSHASSTESVTMRPMRFDGVDMKLPLVPLRSTRINRPND